MGTEIERKFLVINETWRNASPGTTYRQGYLAFGPPVAVRVRLAGEKATLNIKQATLDITRNEFEYPIPREDADFLLAKCCQGTIIEKVRHRVSFGGFTWEVDEFHGANAGLLIAEIEIEHPNQDFPRPPWIGAEVSGDPRYLNTSLAQRPFSTW